VFIEHIPRANVYGIECYNYSSSADSATPGDRATYNYVIQYENDNAKVMSIVVANIRLSVLLKTTYPIMSLSNGVAPHEIAVLLFKCCVVIQVQCCYSSAVKGTIGGFQ